MAEVISIERPLDKKIEEARKLQDGIREHVETLEKLRDEQLIDLAKLAVDGIHR